MFLRHAAAAALAVALGAPEAPRDPQKDYEELFGEQARKVAATPGTTDDAEFAASLVTAAKRISDSADLRNLLLSKAHEFGLKNPSGYKTAVGAIRLLAETAEGGEKAACDERLLEAYQRMYTRGRGRARDDAAAHLARLLLLVGSAKLRGSKATEALALYRRAVPLEDYLPLLDRFRLKAKLGDAADAAAIERQRDGLAAVLANNPDNATARSELIRIHIAELDTPGAAAKLLNDSTDETLRTYVPLAAKPVEEVAPAACAELGRWYEGFVERASPAGKIICLDRAVRYYRRCLADDEIDDVVKLRVKVRLDRVAKELTRLKDAARVELPRGKWLPLMSRPNRLVGWDVPESKRSAVKYSRGVLEIIGSNGITYPLEANDIVLRARMRKLTGQNIYLRVRNNSNGCYLAYYNGSGSFGLGKSVRDADGKGEWTGLKTGTRRCEGWVEMVLSAVGRTITVYVNGKRIIQVTDASHSAGAVGVGVYNEAKGQFRDMRIMIPREGAKPK